MDTTTPRTSKRPYDVESSMPLSPCGHYTESELRDALALSRARVTCAIQEADAKTLQRCSDMARVLAQELIRRIRIVLKAPS